MRICFFTDARSLHAKRVSQGLVRLGHEVTVVGHKPEPIPGVKVERYEVPGPGLRHLRRWAGRREAYLRERVRRFDVVVIFFLNDWGFTPDIVRSGCVVAAPFGSDIVMPPGETPPSRPLVEHRKMLLRHATAIGAFGPTFARIIADYAGMNEEEILPLPLGVDLHQFKPQQQSAPKPKQVPVVGFFRGFRAVYGGMDLVRAIPEVLEKVSVAAFHLVGDGPELARCRAEAETLHIEHAVKWAPPVDPSAVPNLLSSWTLSVMPSVCESFGVAALESSAMGVPVVASDVGGLVDTVCHGRTGILVPPESPSALARAIVTLLTDQPRRLAMGRAGREWVARHHSGTAAISQWEKTLTHAVERVSVYA